MNRTRFFFIILLITATLVATIPTSAQDPDTDDLTVVATFDIDLLAGPINTAAYLAPDGERFAYHRDNEICIYTIQGEIERCTALDDQIRHIDLETVRWSPDSRYLAFTNEFFRTFNDPDLWIIDTQTGELLNLTDDQFDGSAVFSDGNPLIDVLPVWSADGSRLLFARYTPNGDSFNAADLFTIAPDGSDLQQVGTLANTEGLTMSALDWSPDGSQVVYNLWQNDEDKSEKGVWISDLDGSNARQLAQMDTQSLPTTLTFSPDGQYVLTFAVGILGAETTTYEPEFSPTRVLAVADGTEQLPGADAWAGDAGWGPAGHALAYVYANRYQDEENSGLYLAAGPGEPGRLVLQGIFAPPTPRWYAPLVWTANNTLLLSRSPEPGIVVIQLGAGE